MRTNFTFIGKIAGLCLAGILFALNINAQTTFSEQAASKGIALTGSKIGGFTYADFNNDGFQDLLVNTSDATKRTKLFFNQGPPTFSYTDVTATNANKLTATQALGCSELGYSAIAADLNNDGYIDFLRNADCRVEVYINKGPAPADGDVPYSFGLQSGSAGQNPNFTWFTANLNSNAPPIGIPNGQSVNGAGFIDYDNDGDLDIVLENDKYGIDILKNSFIPSGNLNFTHATPGNGPSLGLPQTSANGDFLCVTDYNNDGYVDLVARKKGNVDVYQNNSRGGFIPQLFDLNANENKKGSAAFYDFDKDGDFDLFWSDAPNDFIHQNNGGTFVTTGEPWASAGLAAINNRIDGVAGGDIDNDGDIDLFLADEIGQSYLFINNSTNGNLSFTRNNLGINVTADIKASEFVDFDNDGDLDLYLNINNGANQLWVNNLNTYIAGNSYMMVNVLENRGDVSGRSRPAVGANLGLYDSCGRKLITAIRQVNGGTGLGSQNNNLVHIGLPAVTGPNHEYYLKVEYPALFKDVNSDGIIDTIRTTADTFINPGLISGYNVINIYPTTHVAMFKPSIVNSRPSARVCNDGLDSFVVSTNNTDPAATFEWSTGETTASIAIKEPGKYWAKVTYDNLCWRYTDTLLVAGLPKPMLSVTSTDASCVSTCDGSIDLSVSGTTAPYTYSWNNGANTQDIANACASYYTVSVTGNNGCKSSISNAVGHINGVRACLSTTNVACNANCNGSILLSHCDGAGSVTYQWSNGATSANLDSLCPGKYYLTVTDQTGCVYKDSASIGLYTNLSAVYTIAQPGNNSDNGSIDVTPLLGVPPYSFRWSNGATSEDLQNIGVGCYCVYIQDASGAVISKQIQVIDQGSFTASSIIVNMSVVPQTFSNALKPYGLVYDMVTNYNVPVKWLINSNKLIDPFATPPFYDIDFVHNAKTYKAGPFLIEKQFITPAVSAQLAFWQAQGVDLDTLVYDQILPVFRTLTSFPSMVVDQANLGIVAPYFSNAMIPSSIYDVGLPSDLDACDDIYVLPHADPTWADHNYLYYFNTINNGYIWAGCHAVSVFEGLTDPNDASKRMNFLSSNGLQCFNNNGCSPLITQTHAANPLLPYSYETSLGSDPVMQFMDDLSPSMENGSEQWYIPQAGSIWRPETKVALYTADGTGNSRGSKLLYGPGLGDSINGLVMYQAGHTAAGRGTILSQIASQRAFLNFVIYTGIRKRVNISLHVPMTFVPGIPQNVSTSVISGGVAPFTYTWTASVPGKFGDSTLALTTFTVDTGVAANTPIIFRCIVVDACGRKNFGSAPATVVMVINDPLVVNVMANNAVGANLNCYGDCNAAASASVTGGYPPYNYAWNNGATTAAVSGLCAGMNIVSITDARGCVTVDTLIVNQPPQITVSTSVAPVINCMNTNSQISSFVNGGVGPYTYSWSPPVGLSNPNIANPTAQPDSTQIYGLAVTDAHGCPAGSIANVIVSHLPTAIAIDTNTFFPDGSPIIGIHGDTIFTYICTGSAITLGGNPTASGGTPPYTYLWTPSTGLSSNSVANPTARPLVTTLYNLLVKDSFGCSALSQVEVRIPIQLNVTNDTVYFCQSAGGTLLNAAVMNPYPQAIYKYEWKNQSGAIVSLNSSYYATDSGVYTVIVKDSVFNWCSRDSAVFRLIKYPNPVISVSGNNNICKFDTTQLLASGANTYQWSPSTGLSCADCPNPRVYPVSPINYSITGTDSRGCISSTSKNILIKDPTYYTQNLSICNGHNITVGNHTYTTAGIYRDTLLNSVGCDSIVTTNLSIKPTNSTNVNASICSNHNYTLPNGTTVNAPGNYPVTLTNIFGCDSVVTTHLTILATSSKIVNATICSNRSYILPNGTSVSTAGSYPVTLTNSNGCDSFVTTIITVAPTSASTVNVSICANRSHTLPNGLTVNSAGSYPVTLTNRFGCDSVVTTNVTILPTSTSTVNATICSNQNYSLPNGTVVNTPGLYPVTLINRFGCDSVVNTNLTVLPTSSTTINASICSNHNYTLPNGNVVNASGNYPVTLSNINGCDSVVTTRLTVLATSFKTVNATICSNQSYILPNGNSVSAAGSYPVTLTNAAGCDSFVTTVITVVPTSASVVNASICSNRTYTLPNGNVVNAAGSYPVTLTNRFGCDSVVTTNITILPTSNSSVNATICSNQNYTLPNGLVVNTPGVYRVTLTNHFGCDSVVTTNLTVLSTSTTTVNATICSNHSYTLPNGNVANTSGNYLVTLSNINGCDSFVNTHLTVLTTSSKIVYATICSNQIYTLPNGTSVNTAGSYPVTLTNSNGCDSFVTTVITVAPTSSSDTYVNICSNRTYTLPNGTVVNSAGSFPVTLTNRFGCDSVVTTHVSLLLTSSSTVNATICANQTYTLPNGADINSSGSYPVTLTNQFGCDSVVTTILSVLPTSGSTINVSICSNQSYTLPNGLAVNTSGSYPVILTGVNGCDSVVTTNLTVHNTNRILVSASICANETYRLPDGAVVNTAGTYTVILNNRYGCDSTVVVALTINPIYSTLINKTICAGQSYTLPNGVIKTTSGTYHTMLQSQRGCDSLIITNLTVAPVYSNTFHVTICHGASYQLPNGRLVSGSGVYAVHYSTVHSCDSTEIYILNELNLKIIDTTIIVCEGQAFQGVVYAADTSFFDVYRYTNYPCDSAHRSTHIKILHHQYAVLDTTLCSGESFESVPYFADAILENTYHSVTGCDSLTRTVHISVVEPYAIDLDTTFCAGGDFNGESYQHDDVATFNYTSIHGCDSVIRYHIHINALPEVSAGPDVLINKDTVVVLSAIASGFGALAYEWSHEGSFYSNSPDTSVYLENNAQFIVAVTDANGCRNEDSMNIIRIYPCDLNLIDRPNTITPNGDGLNDHFYVKNNYDLHIDVLRVFNRWGELVYETEDPVNNKWDGSFRSQPCNPGVFVYYIKGACNSGEKYTIKGNVTLIK